MQMMTMRSEYDCLTFKVLYHMHVKPDSKTWNLHVYDRTYSVGILHKKRQG